MADKQGEPLVFDPEKALDEGVSAVKEQSYYMRSALDAGNLREALKFASGMLSELRTLSLSPRLYYQLYVSVFDELRTLESYFIEESRAGRKMATVYEKVQHASHIVPRLYLLITVGAAYIESREAPAYEILKDLLEMVKGVQQPVHGLFLRYYLLKTMKEKLPDKGTPYEGEGGDIDDAVSFIVSNLSEMNRLWGRLGLGAGKDKQKRELQRKELRVTVGENIIRLSSLEGLNLKVYETSVQPKLLEIISQSKDALAQQYLLDCMIQAFPDEYHLQTLDSLLEVTTVLLPQVDVVSIYVNLIERLSLFAANSEDNVEELLESRNVFHLIRKYIDRILTNSSSIAEGGPGYQIRKLLELLVAFIRFSIKSFPAKTQYINLILQSSVDVVRTRSTTEVDNQECLKLLQRMLTIPLETLSLAILSLNQYPQLMQYLSFPMRRNVANAIVAALLRSRKFIDSFEVAQQLVTFILPLLKDQDDYENCENYEFEEEQEAVAKLVHIINFQSLDTGFRVLKLFKEEFHDGGNQRKKFTIPALVFGYLRFARRLDTAMTQNQKAAPPAPPPAPQVHDDALQENLEAPAAVEGDDGEEVVPQVTHLEEEKVVTQELESIPSGLTIMKVYQIVNEILATISPNYPEKALRLYLQALESVSSLQQKGGQEMQHLAYDLASECFTIYQDELSESESKFQAINLIIATFTHLTCLSTDDYDTLAKNATQYAAKQLKKPTQSEAVQIASHLFWNTFNHQDTLVTQCLTRAQNIANICLANPRNIFLLVKLLDKYVYYFTNELPGINAQNVNSVIQVIHKHLQKIKSDLADADSSVNEAFRQANDHFQSTKAAIALRAKTNPRYAQITMALD